VSPLPPCKPFFVETLSCFCPAGLFIASPLAGLMSRSLVSSSPYASGVIRRGISSTLDLPYRFSSRRSPMIFFFFPPPPPPLSYCFADSSFSFDSSVLRRRCTLIRSLAVSGQCEVFYPRVCSPTILRSPPDPDCLSFPPASAASVF